MTYSAIFEPHRSRLSLDTTLKNIASAAFARGAVVGSSTFKELSPRELMRALRGAWEASQSNPATARRVETGIRAIEKRLEFGGPVAVSPQNFGFLASVSGARKGAKKGRARK